MSIKTQKLQLKLIPESSNESALAALRHAGFNRISFGIQSFYDSELRMLGRTHNASNAIKAILTAKNVGFDNISIDLMYGLPKQTPAMLHKNIENAVSLPINHISCYGLRPEIGTPLASSPLLNDIPDDDIQADMYIQTCSFLEQHGFYRYEISNFSQTGKESRHNTNIGQ